MTSLQLPAPVKINLFLHILGRRPDGYHELQTVFQLLDAGDTLAFSVREDGEIRLQCSQPDLQTEDNLVLRAARQLRQHLGTGLGADIRLQKNMPVGGGLGGGSSDAATTLLGLNHLWQGGLEVEELLPLGRSLGADVPVFIQGRTAWAEGVGERLQAIELAEVWYVVLNPNVHVSTASVFTHPELTRDSVAITVAAFLEQGPPTQNKGLATAFTEPTLDLRNDCQPLVATLYPEVAAVIDWLGQRVQGQRTPARMTGTGASVFAACESEAEARSLLSQSPWPGFVAKGINRSPVHDVLEEL